LILDTRIVSLGIALLALVATPALASPERVDELIRTALELDPDVARGAKLYQAQCSNCHGPKAFGDAKQLIPALAGQRRAYLIKQLADFAELERVATQMHRVAAQAEVGEPQEWADITAYINGLPPMTAQQFGDGKDLSLGEAAYDQWCASCHGADGRGDDDGFAPSLRNQHYAYLLHQMRELAVGHRTNVEPELVLFLDSLEAEEMRGLADYMSRMKGPTIDRYEMRDDGFVGD
jgi:ubiquinol-cytochrome c reductase cytochrome c subunit